MGDDWKRAIAATKKTRAGLVGLVREDWSVRCPTCRQKTGAPCVYVALTSLRGIAMANSTHLSRRGAVKKRPRAKVAQ